MIKIWAKILTDHKIVKSVTYNSFQDSKDWSLFPEEIVDICDKLDIPTPVIIKTHIFNYAKFGFVKFKPDDFVEKVDFDALVLENEIR